MNFIDKAIRDLFWLPINLTIEFFKPFYLLIIGLIGVVVAVNEAQSDLHLMSFILGLPLPAFAVLGLLVIVFHDKIFR